MDEIIETTEEEIYACEAEYHRLQEAYHTVLQEVSYYTIDQRRELVLALMDSIMKEHS